ncbi:MAG: hypothetical protein EKK64_03045 [Neisseriaceae bacterium]|nr:MAG: hypothetical protein EKK64_03045 [Neisseriaceae bacterium]
MRSLTIGRHPYDAVSSWFKDGKYHRDRDLPAIIYEDGQKLWYKNGKCHRGNNLPAVVFPGGRELFYEEDICYEITEYSNGSKEYHSTKGLHRRYAPAVIYSNGDVEYWESGRRHREDGPAVIIGNKQYWFENGEFIKCIV